MPRLWPPSSPSTITIQEISNQEVPNQALDVDLLIDKILANDMFKEMVTHSTSETDKLVYFAKTKLDAMENELKATNEALIKEMTDKINTAKAKVDELKKVDTHDDLKTQLESLKASIDTVGDNNNDEIAAVKVFFFFAIIFCIRTLLYILSKLIFLIVPNLLRPFC